MNMFNLTARYLYIYNNTCTYTPLVDLELIVVYEKAHR